KFASGGEFNKKTAASRLEFRHRCGSCLGRNVMAVSHHAAAFADGLQDANNCRRVTVVGFKTLFPRKEEDHGAGRGTETPRRDERSSEAHCRFSGSFGF
ncbi:unnamed protein product, partial [Brassica oleracea]